MKTISEYLLKYQNTKFSYKKCNEYAYFKTRRAALKQSNYSFLYEIDNSFQLICANVIIHALSNKKNLDDIAKDLFSSIYLKSKLTNDEFLQYYHARVIDFRFLIKDGQVIYVPILSMNVNNIYYSEPFKLIQPPYDQLFTNPLPQYIDAFETYNYELFASFFTKLVKIKEYDKFQVFYYNDLETIFVINGQGRLDYSLPLFDIWNVRSDTTHVPQRVLGAVEQYANNNPAGMVDELLKNNLISQRMHDLILKKCLKK